MILKGFLFDLDGVLTDSAEYHYQAWKKLANQLGIHVDREFNEQLKGVSRMDSLERILAHGNISEKFSQVEKEKLAEEKNMVYRQLIQNITAKDILPGIDTLLEEITAHEMKVGLASASKNGPEILERLGLSSYIDIIVDPSSLAKGKPDPEIFKTGAELLGVKSDECIGIEDAAAGIASINGAGMFSVGVGDKKVLQEADMVVPDTSHLIFSELQEAFLSSR